MIYLDSSVILAHVFCEDIRPLPELWSHPLVSSRLAEFESWVRLHAYGKGPTHGQALAQTLARVDLVELSDASCGRVRVAFPTPVRSLDALHLATADFLRTRGLDVRFASYDRRLSDAAVSMGFQLYGLHAL